MALPPKAWAPRIASPRLGLVRFSGAALTAMVEAHPIEGVTVRVYTAA